MGVGALLGLGERQLRKTLTNLANLAKDELAILDESLSLLEAPISRRKIKGIALALSEKVGRLSESEWEDLVGLVLGLVREPELLSIVGRVAEIEDQVRERIEAILSPLRSAHPLARAIDIDRFIDRGPRLVNVTWFCDVRTKFSDSTRSRPASDDYSPQEELCLPMAIFRLKVDELDTPIYFQVTEGELDELISRLDRARKELQYVAARKKG